MSRILSGNEPCFFLTVNELTVIMWLWTDWELASREEKDTSRSDGIIDHGTDPATTRMVVANAKLARPKRHRPVPAAHRRWSRVRRASYLVLHVSCDVPAQRRHETCSAGPAELLCLHRVVRRLAADHQLGGLGWGGLQLQLQLQEATTPPVRIGACVDS